jgi:RNA-directed DNA polymerase
MDAMRQKNQLELAFQWEAKGEALSARVGGTETFVAKRGDESPEASEGLMGEVCERGNLEQALKRVQANKGSSGVDGMTVGELPEYLKEHWPSIREQLLSGTYKPLPVKRVEIPKPSGGMRGLGIPTVLDRLIQQAVLQVLQGRFDETFSEHSYGFRPGRSAHQAVTEAQSHIAAGYGWVVDIDLEKFFDRVNHDMVMSRVARRVEDKRVLKLIRAFLNVGVLEGGLLSPREEGTPQGGPLSPLLSNIMLDDLDKELEERGHRFVRYADDCDIYVQSERAGQRVMKSVSNFIERKLKLRINREKSAVARPAQRSFLGFSFTDGEETRRRIAPKSLDRVKARVRELTRRIRGVSIEQVVADLRPYLRGWVAYFGFCETPSVLRELDSWIRRRLRCFLWQQWQQGPVRFRELTKRGVTKGLAARTAGSSHSPWHLSRSPALSQALPIAYFVTLGLPFLIPARGR